MRFLYKIYSGYDGFRPGVLGARIIDGHLLLGWDRYLDAVDEHDEVWVYFHGPHKFGPGVYAKGRVAEIDREQGTVLLRVTDADRVNPVVDEVTSQRVAAVVAQRFRQVFLYPSDWDLAGNCDLFRNGTSCGQRVCGTCPVQAGLPQIAEASVSVPTRLSAGLIQGFAPAYWVRPSRCYWSSAALAQPITRATDAFTSFKVGNEKLAFPLALGIREALHLRGLTGFRAIVPVPLSPDKAAAGELNRTLALARELAKLLNLPVSQALTLTEPISKRRMLAAGFTQTQFEQRYRDVLQVDAAVQRYGHVLVIDDVSTFGSTLGTIADRLRETGVEVTVATAGQMVLKSVVRNEADILR